MTKEEMIRQYEIQQQKRKTEITDAFIRLFRKDNSIVEMEKEQADTRWTARAKQPARPVI